MPPSEFEPAIPASERPQIHGLDRTATGVGDSEVFGVGGEELSTTNPTQNGVASNQVLRRREDDD
jgi:hypothetical protein